VDGLWVTHSGSSRSSTVYIDRLSSIKAAKVAVNNRFFNPEIPGLSRDNPGISGLEK